MRILIILPINKGTLARRAFDLHNLFVEQHNEVHVLVLNNPNTKEFSFINVRYFHLDYLPIIKEFLMILWVSYFKIKYKYRISLSVVDSASTINILSFGKTIKIGMFRAPIEQLKILNNRYVKTEITYKYLFTRLDQLVTVSEQVKDSILSNYPFFEQTNISTIYNYFDSNKIYSLSNENWKNEEINLNLFTIIHIGRVEHIKQQKRLIRALQTLDSFNANLINMVFVGSKDSQYYQEIKSECIDMKNVYFLGNQINPYKILARANLFVSTSLQEGLPGALIEALLLNIPAIATNSSKGVWEIMGVIDFYEVKLDKIFKTNSGFIIPNRSQFDQKEIDEKLVVETLAESIEYVFNHPEEKWRFDCVKKFTDKSVSTKYLT